MEKHVKMSHPVCYSSVLYHSYVANAGRRISLSIYKFIRPSPTCMLLNYNPRIYKPPRLSRYPYIDIFLLISLIRFLSLYESVFPLSCPNYPLLEAIILSKERSPLLTSFLLMLLLPHLFSPFSSSLLLPLLRSSPSPSPISTTSFSS